MSKAGKNKTKHSDSDFDPGFSFDFGGNDDSASPWEFSGVLAKQALAPSSNTTSIDTKIQNRLKVSQAGHPAKSIASTKKSAASTAPAAAQRPANKYKRKRQNDSDDDNDDDDDDDNDNSEDESDDDQPLPGELDSEDNEDMSDSSDAEEEEAVSSDEDDDDAVQANGMRASEDEAMEGEGHSESDEDGMSHEQDSENEDEAQSDDGADGSDDDDDADGDSQEEEEHSDLEQTDGQNGQNKVQGKQARHGQQHESTSSDKEAAGDAKVTGKAAAPSNGFYAETPEGTKFSAGSFQDLNLSRPLLKACQALGYSTPTPIQAACIPLALTGRDICGSAVTGSGKTAAFALPCLERLLFRPKQVAATYVLILTPTRELAAQVHSMTSKLAQFTDVQVALIVGGLSLQVQAATLRKGPEIVVATPGRMIDHLRNTQSFGLEDLQILVLDEADRLLEMGFKEEVQEIVRQAPRKRQTMLFSATFNNEVRQLVALSLKQPVRLAADVALAAPKELLQEIVRLKGIQAAQKEAQLLALCSRSFSGGRTIIFCSTKQKAHRLKILFGLAKLPPAGELHGNMTQAARLQSLEDFRKGDVAFLIATDVAARGLDILGVQVVINFDAPRTLETYLHRIGRTARAGASGQAVTFIEDADRALLKEVVKKTGVNMKQRLIPPAAVAAAQSQLEKLERDIQAIMKEEAEETAMRKAEMEAAKAANMLEHEDEIYSRPARTWFMTEREKKELAKKSKSAGGPNIVDEDNEDGDHTESRSKANKSQKRAEKKLAAAKEQSEDGRKKKANKLMEETEGDKRAVRGIKAKIRELREQGVPSSKASKIAAAAVTGTNTKKQKKKKQKLSDGPQSLFNGDGWDTRSPREAAAAGSSGGSSGGGSRPAKKVSRQEVNKLKRGGKGRNTFKSKKRYKRK